MFFYSSIFSFILVAFSVKLSFASNINVNIECSEAAHFKVYDSEKDLPEKFQIPYEKTKEKTPFALEEISFPKDRDSSFINNWSPSNLEKEGFLIVQGSRFLNYSKDVFVSTYNKGTYKVTNTDLSPESLILGRFWDDTVGSASLIGPNKQFVCASYGYILSIPPQLILGLYDMDSATIMEGGLEELTKEHVESCVTGHKKFSSPGSLIEATRYGHNEIKFLFKAQNNPSVKVIGFYLSDILCRNLHGQNPIASFEECIKIRALAQELNLPVVPLSSLKKMDHDVKSTPQPLNTTVTTEGDRITPFLGPKTFVGSLSNPGFVIELNRLINNIKASLDPLDCLKSDVVSDFMTQRCSFPPGVALKRNYKVSYSPRINPKVYENEQNQEKIYYVGEYKLCSLKNDGTITVHFHASPEPTYRVVKLENGKIQTTYLFGEHEFMIVETK